MFDLISQSQIANRPSQIATPHATPLATPLPAARVGITIRPGTMADLPFIDKLQKKQSKEVGFFPTMALEGKIRLGHVLVAEASEVLSNQGQGAREVISNQGQGAREETSSPLAPHPSILAPSSLAPHPSALAPVPAGYLIGNDQYFKRDDVGCIFQINVAAEYRRSLVAAQLLKAQFDRSSYGCRLYCCWCAQDIAANRFWESMGFVPLAYRAGSLTRKIRDAETKRQRDEVNATDSVSSSLRHSVSSGRVHIFWQKRIREGDTGDVSRGGTAWWFPFKTNGGAMRADRIVLPIPPGARWEDELPRLIAEAPPETKRLGAPDGSGVSRKKAKPTTSLEALRNGVRFVIPQPKASAVKPVREKKPKPLADPQVAAAARELRDKYLEQVHAGAFVIEPQGKYRLERSLPTTATTPPTLPTADNARASVEPVKLLAA